MDFGINKHQSIFRNLQKRDKPIGRLQFVVLKKIDKCLFIAKTC